MLKHHITLTDTDRTTLEQLLAKGSLAAKTFKRATALLELDRGKTLTAVAATLDVDYNTVAAWCNAYRTKGLAGLQDAPRSGRPIVIDGAQLAAIEPLTGQRLGQVPAQRTKREYTQFCQARAAQYPDAIKIRLGQDNLNTHSGLSPPLTTTIAPMP